MIELVLLRRQDKWAPSQNPYWFRLDKIIPDGIFFRVPAVWAGRKHGQLVVTSGTYTVFPHPRLADLADPNRPETLVETADTRYGGEWQSSWDGERLLINPRFQVPADDLGTIRDTLDLLLGQLPNLDPVVWSGPWYRTKVQLPE